MPTGPRRGIICLCRRSRLSATDPEEVNMAEKNKQAKEPKKKAQKTMMEKRKEKRDKAATKHEE